MNNELHRCQLQPAFEHAMWDVVETIHPIPDDWVMSDAAMDVSAELAHTYCAI